MLEGLTDRLIDLTVVIVETIKRTISKFLDLLIGGNKKQVPKKKSVLKKVEQSLGTVFGEDEYSNQFIFEMSLSEQDRNVFRRDYEVFKVVIPKEYRGKLTSMVERALRFKNLTIENPEAVRYLKESMNEFVSEVSGIIFKHTTLAKKKSNMLRRMILKDTLEISEQAA